MRFTKMQGAGNDYVYVDCFTQDAPEHPEQLAQRISDRHFGVGADGLILICPSDRADAEMRMYNADGSYSEMCGNGIRCVAKFLYDHGLRRQNPLRILSGGELFTLELELENEKVGRVRVDMGEPILIAERIPTTLRSSAGAEAPVVEAPIEVAGQELRLTAVSMGNPHAVAFVEDATDELVLGVGPKLEVRPEFPNRVNIEFVQVESRTRVRQRTWERGSGETLACGTGASAVCVAGVLAGRTERRIEVALLGGELELEWSEADNHVYMTGPAVEVFSGDWPEKQA